VGIGVHGAQFTKTGDPMTTSFFVSRSLSQFFTRFSSPF